MPEIQSKVTRHAMQQENSPNNQEKSQLIEIAPKMMQC